MAGNYLSPSLPWALANPKWAATLNPLLGNPIVNGSLLQGVVLKTGTNVINHGLGRKLMGYMVVLCNAAATFYDNQEENQRPELTLALVSSAPATVSIYVF